MANQRILITKLPAAITFNQNQNLAPVSLRRFSSNDSQHGGGEFFLGDNPNNIDSLQVQDRQERIRKLNFLIHQKHFEPAKEIMRSLILSRSPFSSPTDLFSLFTRSSPVTKDAFSDLLLTVCAELKLPNEATEVYTLIKGEGKCSYWPSFKLFLESLVSLGQHRKTIDIICEIVNLGFHVDKFAYSKAIQSAVKLGELVKAMDFLNDMRRRGMNPNGFIYNILISGLCKEKRIEDARKMFDEMIDRKVVPNAVSFNTLIDGYCKIGDLEKAFDVRERMKVANVEPTIVTFNTLLGGLCRKQMLDKARNLSVEMKARGFSPDGFTLSILFDELIRNNDVESPLAMFEELLEKKGVNVNAHALTVLVNGLCKHAKMDKAEEILKKSIERGFVPTEILFNTIIDGYCRANDVEKALTTLGSIVPTSIAFNSIIRHFYVSDRMNEATEWVKKMVEKGLFPNLQTYNTLIDGYGKSRQFDKCFEILDTMESQGITPNVVTYGSIVNSLCKEMRLIDAETTMRDMVKKGVNANTRIYNMLIHGYCTIGMMEDANRLFEEMVQKGLSPNVVTCNALIHSLCKKGRMEEAEAMASRVLELNVITYNILISGYSMEGNKQKCLELYDTMKKSDIKPTIKTFHSLIRLCRKEGPVLLDTMIQEMLKMDLVLDRILYNELVHTFVELGDVESAYLWHDKMVAEGIEHDKMTFNSLIKACFIEGKLVGVRDVLEDMKGAGLILKADTYSILIKGHCDLMDFNGAYCWYREMQEKGFLLSVSVCNELICGLKEEGKIEEVETICSQMSMKIIEKWDSNEDDLSTTAKN
ncbi:pentatricopeptide repeat-containing protein At5g12100, mitochondrial-like [Impatiens glandulifera]|uniref:pentatricopeptide repeat-containing protein At5g12100, mitochondrial-like n=1 Tax=Impatiens glandulifera TaxID=253017 RepID=UPI001FB11D68|nr:pentatricopeptide repeat-containing protein At5g12100, mitochondrial-like [Impatiens glandulifera]